jgi:hypothetical protein
MAGNGVRGQTMTKIYSGINYMFFSEIYNILINYHIFFSGQLFWAGRKF